MNGYLINDFLIGFDVNSIQISYKNERSTPNFLINQSLMHYLKTIKLEIDKVYDKWDIYKRITNKYEYINTVVKLDSPRFNNTICSYKPISRSYFKLVEILNFYNFTFPESMQSFHLAEGPGGFIEALTNYRNNSSDIYYGITLMEKHKDVPKWNKIKYFLNKHPNINIVYGPHKDGNLYFKHNLDYFYNNYYNKIDFVTGDGGFDYSTDFNQQEENSINLIFCEVLYALVIQKVGGSFVLKIFDSFHQTTLEVIYLLCIFYSEVYMFKPCTSREANSEKYLVCKNMRDISNRQDILMNLMTNFEKMSTYKLDKIFSVNLNSFFISKMQEINAIFGQQQMMNILNTLNLIRENVCQSKDKTHRAKIVNIKKCIQWCNQNNQPFYDQLQDLKV